MQLKRVFYVSQCDTDLAGVQAIVAVARERNAREDLTGALIYTGGHFTQFLEGPEGALDTTLARISHDRRHRSLTVLVREEVAVRRFPHWRMALAEPVGVDDLLRELLGSCHLPAARADKLINRLFTSVIPDGP